MEENKTSAKEEVLNLFEKSEGTHFKYADIRASLPHLTKGQISGAVYSLHKKGKILMSKRGEYILGT